MVTTSQSHWDGLAGSTAMFSEAVVQPAILNSVPSSPVDAIFIRKNAQTRKFEKAWKGRASNFKRVNKQDKNYLSFTIEDLKSYSCPEILQNKTVGCHILTEQIEPAQVAPKRPLRPLPQLRDLKEEVVAEKVELEVGKQDIIEDALEAGILHFKNGHGSKAVDYEVMEQPDVSIETETPPAPIVTIEDIEKLIEVPVTNGVHLPKPTDETSPAFFSSMLRTNDPAEFERYCFLLFRVLGVHDIHRPANHAGADAHGFFKFSTLSVIYTTTLVPAVVQENRLITEHYLNLLKKEKIQFNTTSYTLKDSQKQVWVLCRDSSEQVLRTEDGIKLKRVSVEQLISLYNERLERESVNSDSLWESIKNI